MSDQDERQEYMNRKDQYFTMYCAIEPTLKLWEIANEIEKDLNFTASTKDATLISTHIITNRGCTELMSVWKRIIKNKF